MGWRLVMRRTPITRSPFKRKNSTENIQSKAAQSHAQQAPVAIISIVTKPTRIAPFSAEFQGGIPKSQPVRSEAYRRAVASLACFACGIQGHSQAAHLPPEGKGLKQCDLLTFPLCCVRVGVPGCHQDYDQYRLFNKQTAMTVGRAWAADTQRKIHAMGKWPKGVPYPHDQQREASSC